MMHGEACKPVLQDHLLLFMQIKQQQLLPPGQCPLPYDQENHGLPGRKKSLSVSWIWLGSRPTWTQLNIAGLTWSWSSSPRTYQESLQDETSHHQHVGEQDAHVCPKDCGLCWIGKATWKNTNCCWTNFLCTEFLYFMSSTVFIFSIRHIPITS